MTVPLKLTHYPNTIDLVRQFHRTFKHPVSMELTVADVKLRRLRVALIAEELGELAQALGVPLELKVGPMEKRKTLKSTGFGRDVWVGDEALCLADKYVDIVETADALGDIDYVTQGANLAFGVPAGLVMYAIHGANLSKLDENGEPIFDEMGKVVKGPNYKPPDVKGVLETFVPGSELV